ncbi:Serine/threonine-protein kinase PknB [Rosistilla carotiformis]|uniref:Serine/threonine-protein kinase PknB n=1 Tax=Rosistilla carotiformis TaxID=2528017 RepID=A0A518K1N4_9BACT|nr:serine/threonine-protein kinase [Rosistilla carotiformis]QDV71679.1 Serine/threonine-protein kinase PknB [Rosistilla carotiformis]
MADERDPSVEASEATPIRQNHTTEHGYVTAHDPCVDRTLLLPGMQVDRFVIQREVGRGGFGIVYKALDPNLGRHVAVKVPRADFMTGQTDRLYREAKIVAALDHEGIVKVYEAGTDGELSYIVSQLCDGPDLRTWLLDPTNRLSCVGAAELIAQLADALSYAHRHGVLHRDIKPGNVLLFPVASPQAESPSRNLPFQPRLTDFGLASMQSSDWSVTRTSVVLGTPLYMAPECLTASEELPSVSADIYSLGAVLYELLIGKPPIEGAHFGQLLHRLTTEDPELPHQLDERVPVDLSIICSKCLQKDIDDRYDTVGQLRDDLRRFLEGQPILARVPTLRDKFFKWCHQSQRIRFAGVYTCWLHTALIVWLIQQNTVLATMDVVSHDLLVKNATEAVSVSILLHAPKAWLGFRLARGSRWPFWPSALSCFIVLAAFMYAAFSQQGLFDFNFPSPPTKVAVYGLLITAAGVELLSYLVAIPAFLRRREPVR